MGSEMCIRDRGYPCHICGSDKHKKPDCTKKNLPRERWFITKAMDKMLHQRDDESNDDEYSKSDDDEHLTRSNSSRMRSASRNRSRGRSRARRQSDQEDWCSFQHDWSNMQCTNNNDENDDNENEADIVLKQNSKSNKHINALKNKFLLDTGSMIKATVMNADLITNICCLLYTSPSPRDLSTSRMPSSA